MFTNLQGVTVAIENREENVYALQYHPEVKHSVSGSEVIKQFLFQISHISPDWSMENVLEEELEKLRKVVSYVPSPIQWLKLQFCPYCREGKAVLSMLKNDCRADKPLLAIDNELKSLASTCSSIDEDHQAPSCISSALKIGEGWLMHFSLSCKQIHVHGKDHLQFQLVS